MGAPLRSRLAMDARRAQLLEHGLLLFGTRAYDEVAIDDIAAHANVSKGLLYHYFGSKRAFYLEVVRDAGRMLLAATEPPETVPKAERLRWGIDRYLGFVEQHRPTYSALVTGGLGADPEVAQILENVRQAFVGRAMLDLGLTKPRPIFKIALRGWIGGVEAAAVQWAADGQVPRQTLIELVVASLVAAVMTAIRFDPEAPVDLRDFRLEVAPR